MYFESGRSPGPAGHHHPLTAPAGRFRARDGHLIIAAANDAIFDRLALALGHPEWAADERFRNVAARMRNRPALFAALEAALANDDVDAWVETLNAAGVPAGPVLGLAEVFQDPQVLARDMLVRLPHPEREEFLTTGLPVKLSENPGAIRSAPPLHGEHTSPVLREAGYSEAEIAALAKDGVIGVRSE
jgi:crotonobetainyl-CoA:carnitine CoA-transferase CaiB-like acyl-CoA transferase